MKLKFLTRRLTGLPSLMRRSMRAPRFLVGSSLVQSTRLFQSTVIVTRPLTWLELNGGVEHSSSARADRTERTAENERAPRNTTVERVSAVMFNASVVVARD